MSHHIQQYMGPQQYTNRMIEITELQKIKTSYQKSPSGEQFGLDQLYWCSALTI